MPVADNTPQTDRASSDAAQRANTKSSDGTHKSSRKHDYPGQEFAFRIYNSDHVQVCVAVLIVANFLTNATEKQIDPTGEKYEVVWDTFDWFYNIVFLVELLANLYAHWFFEFWESNWNIFDFIVVTIGVVNMMKLPLPSAFSMLRCMRAFRVFRLFRRVKSLNKIIVAMLKAVPGVCNAFVILTIVMSIYAILGVEFFRNVGDGCQMTGEALDTGSPNGGSEAEKARLTTSRTMCVGKEYFGSFIRSFYTHFQILTGESWSEAIARPVIWSFEDPYLSLGSAIFFCSFVLLSGFVLINVVVAVLLDKMQAAEEGGKKPLTEREAAMMNIYERTGKALVGLAERAASMQENLQALKTEMAEMTEQLAQAQAQEEEFKKPEGNRVQSL